MIVRAAATGARAVAGGLAAALCVTPLAAQTAAPPPPAITVQGQASTALLPDAAQLSVDVDAERPTAGAATAEVARAAQSVAAALRADGLADKDVRTTAVGLEPVYPEGGGAQADRPRLPRAFRAWTTFLVDVTPPERAGALIADLVGKGATGIGGITFTASGEGRARDALRAEAVRDARRKADIYVGALGMHLGTVLEIVPEDSGGPPALFARAGKSSTMAASDVPVRPAPLLLSQTVSVRWAILP